MSLPDIALLQPMAEILGVTVTELLSGQTIRESEPLTVRDVDQLVADTLTLTAREREGRRCSRRRWGMWYATAILCGGLGVGALWRMDMLWDEMASMLLTPLLLAVIFGAYFCFFAREKLPAFYDGNRISFYSDGVFRMNVPGVHFNNSNWPHILRAARIWSLALTALWPLAYLALRWGLPLLLPETAIWPALTAALLAALLGGLFVPVYVVGRKYE